MSTHVFDVTAFRLQFPEFSDPLEYPDAQLQGYWDLGSVAYINPQDNYALTGPTLQLALNLMTAHLAKLYASIDSGESTGLLQESTIDKINVTLTPAPIKTGYQWWLAQTAYGQQLWALFQAASAGGFWFGGSPELSAFRKAGGVL